MIDDISIRVVKTLKTTLKQRGWVWADENRDMIERRWRESLAEKPKLFNGRVLLIGEYSEGEDAIEANYFETYFADFLAWLRADCPDRTVGNGFASAALRCADGAYICGVMGHHTANAVRIYFPGGTPDRHDILPDGRVDLHTSVLRELEEETGLLASDVTIADHWIVARWWPFVSFMRPMQLTDEAPGVVERLTATLARQKDPELTGFKIVRGVEDIDRERMPEFVQAFFRQAWR